MPGTPATSPRHGVPRVANTDTFDIARDVNAAIDRFDITAQRVDFGLATARPAAGIANRFYYATDTNQLTRDTGSAWVNPAPNAHASTHQDGGVDPLTVREAMMATGALGLANGTFHAYRNAALTRATGQAVDFDAEAFDTSNWYDLATSRFVPQVAGVYRLSWCVASGSNAAAGDWVRSLLLKNSVAVAYGNRAGYTGASVGPSSVGSALVKANGTTDFFQIQVFFSQTGSIAITTGAAETYFMGELIGRS